MSKLGDKWKLYVAGVSFKKFIYDLYTVEVTTNYGIIHCTLLMVFRLEKNVE